MKILFATYPGNEWNPGGKERHLHDMASALERLGHRPERLNPWDGTATDFDVLQVFGSEYYLHELVIRAKALGKRVAVFATLVFRDERQERTAAAWNKLDHLLPVVTSHGFRKRILHAADILMFSSEAERQTAERVFGWRGQHQLVPATFAPEFMGATGEVFTAATGLRDFVLYAGRFEKRKNVVRLIRAAKRAGLPLVMIGHYDEADPDYAAEVRAAIATSDQVHVFPRMAAGDPLLVSAFAAARVSALVSHHETCGMVNLEATIAGTNVVTTPLPAVREYMDRFAWYADPNDEAAIAAALKQAWAAPFHEAGRTRVLERFSTDFAARQMLAAYARILP